MCYSVLIKSNLKKTAQNFAARLELESFQAVFARRLMHPELKIPVGIDRYFLTSGIPEEAALAPLVRQFHQEERDRAKLELIGTEELAKNFSQGKPTAARRKKIETLERKLSKW